MINIPQQILILLFISPPFLNDLPIGISFLFWFFMLSEALCAIIILTFLNTIGLEIFIICKFIFQCNCSIVGLARVGVIWDLGIAIDPSQFFRAHSLPQKIIQFILSLILELQDMIFLQSRKKLIIHGLPQDRSLFRHFLHILKLSGI